MLAGRGDEAAVTRVLGVDCIGGRGTVSDFSQSSDASDASDASALLKPGQFVIIRATGVLAQIIGHRMDRGTVTYHVAHTDDTEDGGFLVKDLDAVE